MAETYLTPTFQNAVKPQAQPTTSAAPAPAQTGGEQYQTDTFKKAVAPPPPPPAPLPVPTAAPKPTAPPTVAPDLPGSPRNPNVPMPAPSTPQQQATGGQSRTTGGAVQPDWSIDWSKGGEVKLPQSVQDWGNVAGQQSSMGLAGLKTQADAARARLGPVGAASADLVGGAISPSSLLNAVPYVGPELAGGLHEGLRSYAEGNDWKTIGEDTAAGAAGGFGGQLTGLAAEKALPELLKMGVMSGGAAIGHKVLGGHFLGDLGKELPGLFGIYKGLDNLADWAGKKGEAVASSPAAQQAIRNLVLGGTSAFRQQAGPWDQLIPAPGASGQ